MSYNVNVFFDESGKKSKDISLMGGLLVPSIIYNQSEDFIDFNEKLRSYEVSFHFTDYTKNDFPRFKRLVNLFMDYNLYIKINIVSYKKANIVKDSRGRSIEQKMIYNKIPERVIYGLLRDYGNFADIKAGLFIEKSSEYEELALDKVIKDQLNIHSLYRNENYWVNKANLYEKNKHIGIEFIDTVLGIIRVIIENKANPSNTLKNKHIFINKMLKNRTKLYELLCNINYFELNGQTNLEKKDFKKYIDLFLAQHNY